LKLKTAAIRLFNAFLRFSFSHVFGNPPYYDVLFAFDFRIRRRDRNDTSAIPGQDGIPHFGSQRDFYTGRNIVGHMVERVLLLWYFW
jgi:hypothetical protein